MEQQNIDLEKQKEKKLNEKIKKQKIAIRILSILLIIFFVALILTISNYESDKNTIEVKLEDYYDKPNSLYTIYEVSIYSHKDKTINVNDFTFNHGNMLICVDKIEYNNNTYENDQSFVIYGLRENKLLLYITLSNDQPSIIYYKLNPIKVLNSIKTT